MLMQRIVLFQVWFDCTEDKNQIKILINKYINQSERIVIHVLVLVSVVLSQQHRDF